MELDLKPNTGNEEMKVGLLLHAKLVFGQNYPLKPPRISFTQKKGLDDFLYDEIYEKMNDELKQLSMDKKESEDDTGYLYDFHEKARDILSDYNDTIRGRCAVCLENFA